MQETFQLLCRALYAENKAYRMPAEELERLYNGMGADKPETEAEMQAFALICGCIKSLGGDQAGLMFLCQNARGAIGELISGKTVMMLVADGNLLGWSHEPGKWLDMVTLKYLEQLPATEDSLILKLNPKLERIQNWWEANKEPASEKNENGTTA